MLNTDFAVFYDLQLDQNGKLGCKLNNTCGITNTCDNYCPKASTFENALKYANVSSTGGLAKPIYSKASLGLILAGEK